MASCQSPSILSKPGLGPRFALNRIARLRLVVFFFAAFFIAMTALLRDGLPVHHALALCRLDCQRDSLSIISLTVVP